MFSDVDIYRSLAAGELEISPLAKGAIKPAGVLLHLGSSLLLPQPGVIVDVRTRTVPNYLQIEIEETKPFELVPGGFVLGETYETVSVGRQLGFFVEGRSTLARLGMTVVQTAMLVYPGHRGRAVTLEIANHGPNSILLYPRMKIARAAIFMLSTPSSIEYDSIGKYRYQEGVGEPILEDEFFTEQ